ncbi:MAG TPA: hypothetical protein V6C76_09860 [Drouetiella sp.]
MKFFHLNKILRLALALALTPMSCYAADETFPDLSPAATEVSKDIGVANYITALRALHAAQPDDKAIRRDIEYLYSKQQMTEILLTTFLETRDVTADVDDEMTRSLELKGLLEARRDRAIRLNNITNFTSGGALAMIGSGIQIGGRLSTGNAGNVMEIGAGALSTAISTYALKQSSGEKRSSGANPNMLAKMFDLPGGEKREMPLPVWNFLNEPIPNGNGYSRRDLLIERWVQIGRIPPPKSKAGQRRIALLSGTVPQTHEVTIDLLDDRAAMLNDTRAVIGEMSRQLLEIMQLMRKL